MQMAMFMRLFMMMVFMRISVMVMMLVGMTLFVGMTMFYYTATAIFTHIFSFVIAHIFMANIVPSLLKMSLKIFNIKKEVFFFHYQPPFTFTKTDQSILSAIESLSLQKRLTRYLQRSKGGFIIMTSI
ncbi:MAG: hypothetical protein A2540_04965 [Sulfurimonas sp. RIFOXYD2_FULL_37_8]|nr:MAG: hypothetical protein A2540_04965 [Sulfurimonas sp. RIFOXYD2_FULL_37_8]